MRPTVTDWLNGPEGTEQARVNVVGALMMGDCEPEEPDQEEPSVPATRQEPAVTFVADQTMVAVLPFFTLFGVAVMVREGWSTVTCALPPVVKPPAALQVTEYVVVWSGFTPALPEAAPPVE